MCRLFGLHAGTPVTATFWLLDAPDSLSAQSRRDPDGAGIGVFDPQGRPLVDKAPIAAWQDADFALEARALTSTTFVAHVRYASTGALSVANTHPFTQDGRIFAHNGAFAGLPALDAHLADLDASELVGGQTDSERLFALITAETRRADGDVEAGIVSALSWVARELPAYCLNLLLSTPHDLWALRYPDTNDLYVLARGAGGSGDAAAPLQARSRRIHAHSDDLGHQDAVVVASEPMDDDPRWRPLDPGELLHVDAAGELHSSFPLPPTLSHQLTLADLDAGAAASQRPLISSGTTPSPAHGSDAA